MQNKIALIFDFDDTLAPDSTNVLLKSIGIDIKEFWSQKVQQLMNNNWDPVPAYMYMLIQESRNGKRISKHILQEVGRKLSFNDGVLEFFDNIKAEFIKLYPNIELEFYIVSGGIGEIIRNTQISHCFTHIWSSELAYNKEELIEFPSNIVSFTDKTRYLFQISKGIVGEKAYSNPYEVNNKIEAEKIIIPFENMIYIGDGFTDIPCFSMVRKNGGFAFAVYNSHDKDKFRRAWNFIEQNRVSNLHSANFSKNSDLYNSLEMAIQSIAEKINKNV